MQNYNGTPKKKGLTLGKLILILFFLMFPLSDALSDDAFGFLAFFVGMLIFVWILLKLGRAFKPKDAVGVHTHDRIDHRQDIKINPRTGRPERAPMRYVRHTPQQHWKQQLDGLLANGTIDRAEYNAMLNRKF